MASAKQAHDVDVPAGAELVVVAGQPALDPDDAVDAERAGQFVLDLLGRPVGVAALSELHGPGDQDRPAPLTWMPPPSLTIDEAITADPGLAAHPLRDRGVVVPGGPVQRPHPLNTQSTPASEPAGRDEGGSDVAHPGVVQTAPRAIVDAVAEPAPRHVDVGRVDDHGDRLEPGDGVGHRRPAAAGLVGVRLGARRACSPTDGHAIQVRSCGSHSAGMRQPAGHGSVQRVAHSGQAPR